MPVNEGLDLQVPRDHGVGLLVDPEIGIGFGHDQRRVDLSVRGSVLNVAYVVAVRAFRRSSVLVKEPEGCGVRSWGCGIHFQVVRAQLYDFFDSSTHAHGFQT